MRFHRYAFQIAALAITSMLLLIAFRSTFPGAWSQSPISPVSPFTSVVPGIPPIHTNPVVMPEETSPTPVPKPSAQAFTSPVWLSPLPWIAIGLVVFGAFAWALNAVLGRIGPWRGSGS